MKQMLRILPFLFVAVLACSDDKGPTDPDVNAIPPGTPTVDVRITVTGFVPREVTIPRGSAVRWINDRNVFHTLTPDRPNDPGVWRNFNIPAQSGAGFTFRFTEAGDFSYYCIPHHSRGETGIIHVR